MNIFNHYNQWLKKFPKKWTDILYSYRFVFLGLGILVIMSFAVYLGFCFFEQKKIKEQESQIYQLKQKLSKIEKANGGNILSKDVNIFSQKKAKDFSLIAKETNQYIQFLKSIPSPKTIRVKNVCPFFWKLF